MESIQCNLCRKKKLSNHFLKNGKTLKSCLDCRDKKKTVKDPVLLPVKTTVSTPVPKKEPGLLLENILLPEKIVLPEKIQKGWKILSGKWIKENTERELHQEMTKALIRQFKKRAARPVHEYLMKNVFVDIRDLYTS
jgi:hypothetical protein